MSKQEDTIEKLKQENTELVQALERIREKCTDVEASTPPDTAEILKIIDETLDH